jgi:PAS domain-containing protein
MNVDPLVFILVSLVLLILFAALVVAIRRQQRRMDAALATGKQIQRLLEESELRFRILTRATNEAVWDWNIETDAMWWNP